MSSPQPPPLSEVIPVEAPESRDYWIAIGASALCFAIACALPALKFQNTNGSAHIWYGGTVFLVGWMAALVGQLAWFANLLLFGSWISLIFRSRFGAVVFSLVALLIASQTYTLFGDPLPADEGGVNKMALTHILPGFYFWLSSIIISVMGGVLCRSRR